MKNDKTLINIEWYYDVQALNAILKICTIFEKQTMRHIFLP